MTGPTSVSIDEMEALEAAAPAQNLAEIKLSGEGVPEELRDKSVASVMETLKATQDALKISEKARQDMQQQFQAPQPPAAPPPPKEEPDLTMEQIKEIYEEDPMRAMQIMSEQSVKKAEKNLESRLGPIVSGNASQAERAAKARYATEFEMFGDQIQKVIDSVPGGRKALSMDSAWDDLMSYVRGLPGNVDKLVERKIAAMSAPVRDNARQTQAQTMGFSPAPRSGATSPAPSGDEDPIETEIRTRMGMSAAEWNKWKAV